MISFCTGYVVTRSLLSLSCTRLALVLSFSARLEKKNSFRFELTNDQKGMVFSFEKYHDATILFVEINIGRTAAFKRFPILRILSSKNPPGPFIYGESKTNSINYEFRNYQSRNNIYREKIYVLIIHSSIITDNSEIILSFEFYS